MINDAMIEKAARAAVVAKIDGDCTLEDYLVFDAADAMSLGVTLISTDIYGKPIFHPISDIRGEEQDEMVMAIARKLTRAALTTALPLILEEAGFTDDLTARCAEIVGWHKTGLLEGPALRAYATAINAERGIGFNEALGVAEHKTKLDACRAATAIRAMGEKANG